MLSDFDDVISEVNRERNDPVVYQVVQFIYSRNVSITSRFGEVRVGTSTCSAFHCYLLSASYIYKLR